MLPALTVDAAPLIDIFAEFCLALWKREIYSDTTVSAVAEQNLRTVAELHIRITPSLLLTPHTTIALDTAEHDPQWPTAWPRRR